VPRSSFDTLVYGRKQWFLVPPAFSTFSTHQSLQWAKEDLPKQAAPSFTCIQEAGDVLFVPASWGSAVVFLDESIGVTHEFSVGAEAP
jgi:ribosomal protein L16 Arg81 hydroxylase